MAPLYFTRYGKLGSACLVVSMAFLVPNCKVLSKQEKSSVTSLAQAIQLTADLPKQSTEQYYQIVIETSQTTAAVQNTSGELVSQLDTLLSLQKQINGIIAEYGTRYGILKKYAAALLALTDTSYLNELGRQKDAFIPAFDTLIARYNTINPTQTVAIKSLGDLVKNIIDKIGGLRIRRLQHMYLKELVNAADSSLPQICDQYALDSIIHEKRLGDLKETITQSYKSFWNAINLQNRADAYSNYKIYNPIYLEWQNKNSVLIELNKTNSSAFKKLKVAHRKLKELVNKKATFKEFFQSVKDLYGDINILKESYKTLEKDFTPSN